MKVYLVPVSLTVSMMSPAVLATLHPAPQHTHARQSAVVQLQEHSRSLAELLQQPVDSQALHQLEELSYQLEGDLLALGSAWARVAEPLESLHQAVELGDPDAAQRHARGYLEAMYNWQSGSLS